MLAFPSLLLAMTVVAVFGRGTINLISAVAISLVPQFVRLVRGTVLSAKMEDYVEAARLVGCKDFRIVVRHILPNIAAPIFVLATVAVAWATIIGASLSFLGLGVQPPNPEWGVDVARGRQYLATAWWISTFPGLALMLTVMAVNIVGDGLRDILDPRLRNL